MASTQTLICVANILVLLSAGSDGKNQSPKNNEPHLRNFYHNKCLNQIQGIPLCKFLSQLGLFQEKPHQVMPGVTSILVSGQPELIIKQQLTAELHIPLTTNCDTKKEKKLKFKKITRPKHYKKVNNVKLILEKINGPKKIIFKPIKSDVVKFQKIRRPNRISFKSKKGKVSKIKTVVTSHKITRPTKTTFTPKKEILEDDTKMELQKIRRPKKTKFNQKNKELSEVKEENLIDIFHKITRPQKIIVINEGEDQLKLNKIKRPTKVVFEPKHTENETAVAVAVDDSKEEEEKATEKTITLKPENLIAADSSEEKVEKLEVKNCGSGECGNGKCKCKGQEKDSLENYDDYIDEEHDKCGCKGKDVVDYDVSEVDIESKNKTVEIVKEQPTEIVPEEKTVTETPCDDKLYNLLLIIAPKLSRKLKMASEMLKSSGSRSLNPLDPDFLKKLQRMAAVSSPSDIAKTMKVMPPLPPSDVKQQ